MTKDEIQSGGSRRMNDDEHHPKHSHTLQEMYAELHLYEEINEHYAKCNPGASNLRDWVAERMDKPQPVQPEHRDGFWCVDLTCNKCYGSEFRFKHATPQRPWVGLTDEDLKPLSDKWRIVYGGWVEDFAKEIEAKLKERNS